MKLFSKFRERLRNLFPDTSKPGVIMDWAQSFGDPTVRQSAFLRKQSDPRVRSWGLRILMMLR